MKTELISESNKFLSLILIDTDDILLCNYYTVVFMNKERIMNQCECAKQVSTTNHFMEL